VRYAELWQRVSASRREARPEGPVAVEGGDPLDLFVAIHLAVTHGLPLLPLGPHLDTPEREHLLAVTGAEASADAPARLLDGPPPPSPASPGTPLPADATQLFMATSGTTGTPKAVMLSPANLGAAVAASSHLSRLAPGDTWLACLPLYHIGGLAIVLRCAAAGATVLLHRGFDPERVWADLERYRVSHVSLVPPMLRRLLDTAAGAPPPPALRMVLTGGGPLDPDLCREAVARGWPVCPTYGMSECASQVATLCPAPADWRHGEVGRPLPGVRVEVVDDAGETTAGEGWIRVRGPNVMRGYADGSGTPGIGLDPCGAFVTGDRGQLGDDGTLTVRGRGDATAVTGGVNVSPAQVERRMRACPGIDTVTVRAEPDPLWGAVLAAEVTGPWDRQRVEAWCRAHLPGPLRPRRLAVRTVPSQ
jgi:O-succinylbenzoic acid--CoA ligase